MNSPKLSIIAPIYNVEKYLSRCIDSLLNQTLKDIEIILVDDGSPDSCPKMCDDYASKDSRIKVIHKKNEGLGFARTSGLEIATGEFVAFVDSDDYVHLQMYEKLYNQVKDLNLDAVFCGYNKVDKKQNIRPISEVDSLKTFDSPKEVQGFLLDMIGTEPNYVVDRKYQMSVCCAIYSKKIIDKHNLRFCSEREFISEDLIFHIDYLQKTNKIAFISTPMYYYCDNADSSSLTKAFRKDRFERYVILYSEICSRFPVSEVSTRAKRLLIGYTRSLIFQLNNYDLTFDEKVQIIKSICNDNIWDHIYIEYKYKRLPFYQRLIFYLVKKRQYYFLIFFSFIKKRLLSKII